VAAVEQVVAGNLTKKEKEMLKKCYDETDMKKEDFLEFLIREPITLIDMGDLDLDFDIGKNREAVEYLKRFMGKSKWFTEDNLPRPHELIIAMNDITGTPIKKGNAVIYLGEIPNMKGHIVFIGDDGKIYWGYHPENFRKAKEEEI